MSDLIRPARAGLSQHRELQFVTLVDQGDVVQVLKARMRRNLGQTNHMSLYRVQQAPSPLLEFGRQR